MAILGPSGHFNGQFTYWKYKKKYKYVMWYINLKDFRALIDILYKLGTQIVFW